MTTLGLLSAFVFACAAGEPPTVGPALKRYDGWQAARVRVDSLAHAALLQQAGADVGCELHRGESTVLLPPGAADALAARGMHVEISAADIQRQIDAERARLERGAAMGGGADGPWFADFKNLDAVDAYINTLIALRPELASRQIIGLSVEQRPIWALRISSAALGQGRGCKPAMLVHSCQHAREWISVMASMYVADTLVRNYGTDPAITQLVDHGEWLIVPVNNPDGYSFSWTTDRLWRKNRRVNSDGTIGVDLNRNWAQGWGLALPHSSAGNANPNSGVYWGPSPFSEPETRAVRDLAIAKPGLRGHLDLHSFGQLLIWPWGSSSAASPDQSTFFAVGSTMRDRAQAVAGAMYLHGPIYWTVYPAAGVSVDWMYADRQAFSFTYELRDRGTFILPPEQIIPACEEAWAALKYQAEWTIARYPFRADFDGNCLYNINDFIAFNNAFAALDPAADFDQSGSLNVNDFMAFLNAWGAGQ
ncbi:MAG: M14 family zinc carboxypeptidase [Phycisphaerales bacterium]